MRYRSIYQNHIHGDLYSRAARIETSFGYNTLSFLQALQTFINIRLGWHSTIYSDPRSQLLIGSDRELTWHGETWTRMQSSWRSNKRQNGGSSQGCNVNKRGILIVFRQFMMSQNSGLWILSRIVSPKFDTTESIKWSFDRSMVNKLVSPSGHS